MKSPFSELSTNPSISNENFNKVQKLMYRQSGVHLSEAKRMLVISRLAKLTRKSPYSSIDSYIEHIWQSKNFGELQEFVNALTTNKTDFFREADHFDFLSHNFIPSHRSRGFRELRFWSAACSTGEEPYTAAMVLDEALKESGIRWKILATDIDSAVLQRGQRGQYPMAKIDQIPTKYRDEYLIKSTPDSFTFKPKIKRQIFFKPLNLSAPYPFKKLFDVVFCRNVLIYFTNEDRKSIVGSISRHIRPGGILCLGHSEALLAENFGFRSLGSTIYIKE